MVFASHYRVWNRHGECWILFQPYREQNVWNVNKNIKSMFPFCFQGCSWVLNWSSNMWVDNWNVPDETLTLKTIALFCQDIFKRYLSQHLKNHFVKLFVKCSLYLYYREDRLWSLSTNFLITLVLTKSQVWCIIEVVSSRPSHFCTENIELTR